MAIAVVNDSCYLVVFAMTNAPRKRAIQNCRARLTRRGLTRFEIMAFESDRELIRTLARRLAEEGPDAEKIRLAIKTAVVGKPPKTGNILTTLRRSPLVGADLDLSRPRQNGRKVNL